MSWRSLDLPLLVLGLRLELFLQDVGEKGRLWFFFFFFVLAFSSPIALGPFQRREGGKAAGGSETRWALSLTLTSSSSVWTCFLG
jgi:hypothetical protein